MVLGVVEWENNAKRFYITDKCGLKKLFFPWPIVLSLILPMPALRLQLP
jgi:hypothetical protein